MISTHKETNCMVIIKEVSFWIFLHHKDQDRLLKIQKLNLQVSNKKITAKHQIHL